METRIALEIAKNIKQRLQPFCETINIAGSIRRKKTPEVKDIEIVCFPKVIGSIQQTSLFGVPKIVSHHNPISEFTNEVNNLGRVIKGNSTGRYMQIQLPEKISLDLFIPQSHDYYRQFATRTGSADYAHHVIANAWRKNGWVGTSDGLRRFEDCEQEEGKPWICVNPDPKLPPAWQSEAEFFEWLGIAYLEPEDRIYK